jgi:autotransporter strand-loop-strand O-heptosyltransferase
MYENIKRLDPNLISNLLPVIVNHYADGAYIEIQADPSRKFIVEFLDETGRIMYKSELTGGMWSKTNKKYFVEATCRIYENGTIVYDKKYDATGKNVCISLHSSSLGDTLAWLPYAEEFRKKHNCNLYVSTFINDLFIDQYPEINFIAPGTRVENLYAFYPIGWFYKEAEEHDIDRNPIDFKSQPMQKSAADILGLEYREIKPLVNIPNIEKKKRVGLGIHSTTQAKYWNNSTGWQEVTDYLKAKGYEVVIYSKEGDGYMGNWYPKGVDVFPAGPLNDLINDMVTCEFFIGIGSGLSWLAWSLNVPVVLISGFSDTYTEPASGVTRVINKQSCNSCFNRKRLNAADWRWCPDHKDTDRMFECTKSITGQMVINAIESMPIEKEYTPITRDEPKTNGSLSAWGDIHTIIKDIINRFDIKQSTALEFGVERGFSTSAISNYFSSMIGVDTFEGDQHAGYQNDPMAFYESVKGSMAPFRNVTLIKSLYQDYIKDNPELFDFIHVDIVHDYEHTYNCGEWSVNHAYVTVFHDTESFPEVKQACLDLAKKYDLEFYNYKPSHGLGILVNKSLKPSNN